MRALSLERIFAIATAENLPYVAALRRDSAESILSASRPLLELWQSSGYAAEMKYMLRDPGLFTGVEHLLANTHTLLLFLVPYCASGSPSEPPLNSGRIARYAWGEDYHLVLRRRLSAFVEALEEQCAERISYRAFSDAVPLLERALAAGSGLTFIGRNAMAIRPGIGSYFFVAELLLAAKVAEEGACSRVRGRTVSGAAEMPKAGSGCGSCRSCQPHCPTGAIVADGVIDAGKCISYLTIEKRGVLSRQEAISLGNWLFGCDLCQEVCPFNHGGIEVAIPPEFLPQQGAGSYLTLVEVLNYRNESEFKRRFGRTALSRAGRGQLVRNACCLAYNQGDRSLLPLIRDVRDTDASVVAREQAESVISWWGAEPLS